MIALEPGGAGLVEVRALTRMTIVIRRIVQDKIYSTSGKVQTVEPTDEPLATGENVDLTQTGKY